MELMATLIVGGVIGWLASIVMTTNQQLGRTKIPNSTVDAASKMHIHFVCDHVRRTKATHEPQEAQD
jgi:hypothetical protein